MTRRTPSDRRDGRGIPFGVLAVVILLPLAWLAAAAASPTPSPTASPTPSPTVSPGSLPSRTTLSAPFDVSNVLQFTLIATVSGSGPTPTGTVTFSGQPRSGSFVTTVPLDASGRASLQQEGLCCGDIVTYQASYNGDARYARSTATLTLGFSPPPVNVSTTTLVASPTSARFGEPVLLTATTKATDGSPVCNGGTMLFLEGEQRLGEVDFDNSGIGTLTVSTLGVGTHHIIARSFPRRCANFPSSPDLLPSDSDPVTVVITAPGLPATGQAPAPGPPAGPALAGLAAAVLTILAFAARRRLSRGSGSGSA